MANSQKIRATYENLFQRLVNTTKGNQKISNFIKGFKTSIQGSLLPMKLAEARVSLAAIGKVAAKKKSKAKASTSTTRKKATTSRKKKAD